MRTHNAINAILEKAENQIKEAQKKDCLGDEIESLNVQFMPEEWQKQYKKAYNNAKKENPEIWTSTSQDLPTKAFYNNEEFFLMLEELENVEFLLHYYPEKKEEIKKIIDEKLDCTFSNMCSYLKWYLRAKGKKIDFEELKLIAEKGEARK